MFKFVTSVFNALLLSGTLAFAAELPANTWVRLADCPGDAEGREVPPGRASTWTYCPPIHAFLRYGGYTPRFSNAIDSFDPAAKKWTRLFAEDENYPINRPGGACETLMVWDALRQCVWFAGGQTRAATGLRGIWRYDPIQRTFLLEATVPGQVQRMAFDSSNGVFVASPAPGSDGDQGGTWVYMLTGKKWERKATKSLPQVYFGGHGPIVYDEAQGRTVAILGGTWAFDAASFQWELLTSNAPPARAVTTLAYDPDARCVMLFGGCVADGDAERSDTWYFHADEKTWSEVKTPGPSLLLPGRAATVTYRFGLANDPVRHCMALMDADLGVWQFRYDPKSGPGSNLISNGFAPCIGAAATNAPAEGPAEIRMQFPSPLNPRLADLPDNTLLRLRGAVPGNEIAWCYDRDAGVFVKYGGCGNGVNPYWTHYGNDMTLYDPGTEKCYVRRASDVSGGARPPNGCTRAVTYDAKRRLTWTFGTVGSGPYMPAPPQPGDGYYRYDLVKDVFMFAPIKVNGAPAFAQNCYMEWDPDHDLAIIPGEKVTYVFDFNASVWTIKPSPDCPGPMYVYQRLAYVRSKKAFLRLADVPTGKTSSEMPADALPAEKAAGVTDTFWTEDKPAKLWRELALRTYFYDPVANTWTDMKPARNPPYRNSKYGLAYDATNDVAILIGGDINWNGPSCKDMWAYDVKKNEWAKLDPHYADAKDRINFQEGLMADYDCRHNTVLFRSGWAIWAYRYRK